MQDKQDKQIIDVLNSNHESSPKTLKDDNLDITIYSDDEMKRMVWAKAFDAWISHFESLNTVRVYRQCWRYFLDYSHLAPWEVGRSILVDYLNDMRSKGLSDSTIELRFAALSSFYDFVCRDYTIISGDREIPLYDRNPANGKLLRKKLEPYKTSNWLDKEEIKQLFNAIPRDTIQGLRDYSIFLLYILTGRRNSEVRNLKWGDIAILDDGTITYIWNGKYAKGKRYEMPKSCYEAIVSYLELADRIKTIQKEDYLFVGVIEKSGEDNSNYNHPLSRREIGRLLKKYCKLAGIEKNINCHSLRHSAATLHRACGMEVEEVSKFLCHARTMTTFVYLRSIESYKDGSLDKVEKMLDL